VLYAAKDGRYYLYPTTDGCEQWRNHDFHCYSSPDLRQWRYEGVVMDLKTDCSWADERAWAPCIIERQYGKGKKTKYKYFYYFVADNKIGVATGDSPAGPFRDALGRPLITKEHPALKDGAAPIDPDVFQDPQTGKYYLYWGNGTLVCSELADNMTSISRDHVLFTRKDKARYNYNEGPYVFYRNGLYYFTWSENDTRSKNYRVRYLISDSPTALVRNGQPAAVEPAIVLQRDDDQQIFGTGHHAVIQRPGTDEWYIVYHRFQRPRGQKLDWSAGYNRETCIDPLTFDGEGHIIPVKPSR
jgi:beta-xylosidase